MSLYEESQSLSIQIEDNLLGGCFTDTTLLFKIEGLIEQLGDNSFDNLSFIEQEAIYQRFDNLLGKIEQVGKPYDSDNDVYKEKASSKQENPGFKARMMRVLETVMRALKTIWQKATLFYKKLTTSYSSVLKIATELNKTLSKCEDINDKATVSIPEHLRFLLDATGKTPSYDKVWGIFTELGETAVNCELRIYLTAWIEKFNNDPAKMSDAKVELTKISEEKTIKSLTIDGKVVESPKSYISTSADGVVATVNVGSNNVPVYKLGAVNPNSVDVIQACSVETARSLLKVLLSILKDLDTKLTTVNKGDDKLLTSIESIASKVSSDIEKESKELIVQLGHLAVLTKMIEQEQFNRSMRYFKAILWWITESKKKNMK